VTERGHAVVRASGQDWATLEALLTLRYPGSEWATFFEFGWRLSGDVLVLTITSVVPPEPGDMSESVAHVEILEPYTLRAVLHAERGKLALGVVHSHPEGYRTVPSAPSSRCASGFGGVT